MLIKKEYKMYCGHRNQDLKDKCFRPHGHDYKIFFHFNVVRNGSISTLFGDFDSKIEPLLKDHYDHRFLIDKNDPLLSYLQKYEEDTKESLGLKIIARPTSVENLCFELWSDVLKFDFDIEKLEIQETRSSTITYTRKDFVEDYHNFISKNGN